MKNILTFDVEDWFQVFYGEPNVSKEDWDQYPEKINELIINILAILERHKLTATFFIVGWLADKYPALIRLINQHGHEIASHSYWHTEIFNLTPAQFMEDTKKSKIALENAAGVEVVGYRAPGYSINKNMSWALPTLAELGFKYDSSLLYLRGGLHVLDDEMIELAPNSIGFGEKFIPVNGGFVFRATPYFLYNLYIKFLEFKNEPLNFYTHSWEVMSIKNRLPLTGFKKFIQYFNTSSVSKKLELLLISYQFTNAKQYILDKGHSL